MHLTQAEAWACIASASIAMALFCWGIFRHTIKSLVAPLIAASLKDLSHTFDKRFNQNDLETKRTKASVSAMYDKVIETRERVVRMEAQFGNNGGGLRQAVNEMAVDLAELKGVVRMLSKEQQS